MFFFFVFFLRVNFPQKCRYFALKFLKFCVYLPGIVVIFSFILEYIELCNSLVAVLQLLPQAAGIGPKAPQIGPAEENAWMDEIHRTAPTALSTHIYVG